MANVRMDLQNQKRVAGFLRQAGRTKAPNGGRGEAVLPEHEVCIANIGPKERRRRFVSGLVGIGAGLVMAVVMVALHLHPLWRLLLFFPFAGGASGYFQAADKT